jgi:hypothetical protein
MCILYTSNLRGNLELLPRLHTFIKQLKALPIDDESDVMLCPVQPPPPPRSVLFDLGNACDPAVWHCAATAGRSMLIALDAMGYDAANVQGMLTAESRARLKDNLMGMALVDDSKADAKNRVPTNHDDLVGTPFGVSAIRSIKDEGCEITMSLVPSSRTHVSNNVLFLADVQAGQVGMAKITYDNDRLALQAHAILDLPPDTPPDPTIAGTVDFILNEAQLYERKQR